MNNHNNSHKLVDNVTKFWHKSNQWFWQTPDRALEEAYQAALKIKDIETKHFNGRKITEFFDNYSPTNISCFQTDLIKYLGIIKVKIAEFKTSRFLLQTSNYSYLEKINLIDNILLTYQNPDSDLLTLQPLNINDQQPFIEMKSIIKNNQYTNDSFKSINVPSPTQKTGFFPRSIGRTMQKIKIELNPKYDEEVINEIRKTRRNTQRGIRFLFLIILIPLLLQKVSKEFFIFPLVNQYHTIENSAIFLNHELKNEALEELEIYERELKFNNFLPDIPKIKAEEMEEKIAHKVTEIAEEYHYKGNNAISNCFADLVGFLGLILVVIIDKKGVNAIKNLLNEIIYDLSDSAKAFILILFTDIFVGFHSPHGWEVILEGLANHLGIAPNHSAIFLFIATFPVILDTIFKYWIFRYLNQISPSAVATLKSMNE
jgi:hypothetical protein